MEIARLMGANSPIAVQSCVLTLRSQKFEGLEAGLLREADSQAIAYASGDFLKGINAVKSKTAPTFLGWEEGESK
jgi:enoyl-CoA hydratase/carnithine racemase